MENQRRGKKGYPREDYRSQGGPLYLGSQASREVPHNPG